MPIIQIPIIKSSKLYVLARSFQRYVQPAVGEERIVHAPQIKTAHSYIYSLHRLTLALILTLLLALFPRLLPLPGQEATRDAPRRERAGPDVGADERAPSVLATLQLLDFLVGVDVVVGETGLGISVLGGLGGDGAEGVGVGFGLCWELEIKNFRAGVVGMGKM